MYQVAIIGAAGFVGGELIRVLSQHPKVSNLCLQSRSQVGEQVGKVHRDLYDLDLYFIAEIDSEPDVIFISRGHGQSKAYFEKYLQGYKGVVIDMSRDFRIESAIHPFVYGLPEWQKHKIASSRQISNCGCFATALQLALLPMFKNGWAKQDFHVHGITGSTGAGYSLLDTTHFSWRNSNVSVYKPFHHQHLDEVYQLQKALQPDFNGDINFIPIRGNFTRGIIITAYSKIDQNFDAIYSAYQREYKDDPFTIVTQDEVFLKQVVNTNKCLIKLEQHGDKLLITSMIDNLLKGAAGQAVENMNIALGIDQTSGLLLKPSAF